MSVDVYWTKEAERTFNENIEYLSDTWDIPTINGFLDRVDEAIGTLKKSPNLYPLHRRYENVHKCVLNKHISLYYMRVGKSRIDLLTFWNSHQDPRQLTI